MVMLRRKQTGFTIVELLVVIVVIGILAAITIVAYNGVQNRASDAAVQSDLRNVGSAIARYKVTEGKLPSAPADYTTMNLRVSRNAYGHNYTPAGSSGYNMIFCFANASSDTFAVVAASKSGNVFVYRDGSVRTGVGPLVTYTTTCANNGVNSGGTWFYSDGSWQSYIGG